MTDQATPRCDPRASSGPFHDLMKEIRLCKEARTCPDLFTSRSYYFEPNPHTAPEWQAEEKAYSEAIDCRVVFVCESPGRRLASEKEWPPSRCWVRGDTPQNKRFLDVRKEHDLNDCYITNTVKCGTRKGKRHKDAELTSCLPFLVRELELLRPLVAVAVGGNAYRTLRQDVLHRLDSPPIIFEVTHYSARGKVEQRWQREFAELERLLARLRPR